MISGCAYGGLVRSRSKRGTDGARAQACARRWIEGTRPAAAPPVVHGERGREVMSPGRARRMVHQPNNPRRCAEKLCTGGCGWLLTVGMRPLDRGPPRLFGPPTFSERR